MPLIALREVSLAFGHHPLLAEVSLEVEPGERICLIGRNGTGKSTLLRVISDQVHADEGEVWRKDGLRIAYLEQDVPPDDRATVYQVVAAGLGELGRWLSEYHDLTHAAQDADPAILHRLSELQHRIESRDGWSVGHKVDSVLGRLGLPADDAIASCSGGVRRRVMLAQALVQEPELLLLDEPTNHMDIAAINWLEEFLLAFTGAVIFITHDRTLLRHLATRIIELDRGVLTSFPGDYDNYLRRKDEMLESEVRAYARFDKKLAEEEAWIRKGIKARRTRNEGRVRALEALRRQRAQRLERSGKVKLGVDSGETSGKLVVDLRHVSFGYGDRCVVRDLSTRIMRGDRIGIVGPNGSGKSTLLRLILGDLEPERGEVVRGTKLQMAYFDQQRSQLNPDKTVRENLSDGADYVPVRGKPRHVISYLKDFLFPPQRVDAPVRILSGGERNRLLLAKIFTLPANLLVLDEPTNDLDVETLELLEELLTDYDGTLLLVSHDRSFLDNVVTSTLVFEGDGHVGEYVGGYDDWLRQRRAPQSKAPVQPAVTAQVVPARQSAVRRKLSYKDQRELDSLPQRIEALEAERAELERQVSSPGFYQQEQETVAGVTRRLQQATAELESAFARWEELESATTG